MAPDPGKAFLSQLKLHSDYLKWNARVDRYETWGEACADVLDTHRIRYGEAVEPILQAVLPSIQRMEFLPSMRHLQFRGEQILRNHARLYNCCATYAYSPDVFHKGFFVLLSGAGLGVSMRRKFIEQLPPLERRNGQSKVFTIADSIEGWADGAKTLLSSYCRHRSLDPEWFGHRVVFDYSLIRPKGSPITGGFLAPGPDGLRQSFDRIGAMLDEAIGTKDRNPFSSLLAYDLFMHLSDAVLSGGIRRSAMNILVDPDDEDLIHAKTGEWRLTHPWRARSNNSVGLMRHSFSLDELRQWLSHNQGDNDLGLVFLSHEDDIFNPCYEIGFNFYERIADRSEAVFQFCNLNEINASACIDDQGAFSREKFLALCRMAAMLGTLQAGYADFPMLGRQTEEMVAGEALLGVSVTGWMCRPELFDEALLVEGAHVVQATNREVAQGIGIRPAARATTVKPSGNASVVLQTSPGIHPEHARRYFRIMQLARNTPTALWLAAHHPEMLEPSRWSATDSDYAVFVPCENPPGVITKKDMQGVRHLRLIELVRESWVAAGKTAALCYRSTTSHNVSNTVILDDLDAVTRYVFDHQDHFTALSFLAPTGDKDYAQAPYTEVLDEEEFTAAYGPHSEELRSLVHAGLAAFDGDLWKACDHLLHPGDELPPPQAEWIESAREIAIRLSAGEIKHWVYALKDRFLLDKWTTIQMKFKDMPDLGTVLRQPPAIDVQQTNALACHAEYCDTDIVPAGRKE